MDSSVQSRKHREYLNAHKGVQIKMAAIDANREKRYEEYAKKKPEYDEIRNMNEEMNTLVERGLGIDEIISILEEKFPNTVKKLKNFKIPMSDGQESNKLVAQIMSKKNAYVKKNANIKRDDDGR